MRLTDEQLTTFENLGYVYLPTVLGRDRVDGLLGALRALMEGPEGTTEDADRSWWENLHPPEMARGPVDRWECRNIVTKHPALLELVDLPEIVVPIAQILGSNIALLSSHALVRHRTTLSSAEVAARPKAWHRDLGSSSADIGEPLPRLAVKAAVWLTHVSSSANGPMCVVPGSHRLSGPPAADPSTGNPYGEVEIRAEPGDILLFEQRLWHAPSAVQRDSPRVAVFYCYGYRWLRPQDYSVMPDALLRASLPVRRQLLGAAETEMGYHLPTPDDIPLRTWLTDRLASAPKAGAS
jgi:ectoine hydroxylase